MMPLVSDSAIGDAAALARLHRWGGPPLVQQMARLFSSVVPERIAEARLALGAADLVTVERCAHSIHSSTAQLGALRMRELSFRAERLAAAGDGDSIPMLLDALEREFASFASWLEHTIDHVPEAKA